MPPFLLTPAMTSNGPNTNPTAIGCEQLVWIVVGTPSAQIVISVPSLLSSPVPTRVKVSPGSTWPTYTVETDFSDFPDFSDPPDFF